MFVELQNGHSDHIPRQSKHNKTNHIHHDTRGAQLAQHNYVGLINTKCKRTNVHINLSRYKYLSKLDKLNS